MSAFVVYGGQGVGAAGPSGTPTPPAVEDPQEILGADLTGAFDYRSAIMTGSTWSDQTGVGDLIQSSEALRPVAGTAINGKATLLFDGANDYMLSGAISSRLVALSGAVWVVGRALLLQPGNATPSNNVGTWGDGQGYIGASLTSGASSPRAFSYRTSYRNTPAGTTIANGDLFVQRVRYNSATLYHQLNGGAEQSVAAPNGPAVLSSLLNVGRGWNGVYLNFEAAAFYFTDISPSTDQLDAMDEWISSEFGL